MGDNYNILIIQGDCQRAFSLIDGFRECLKNTNEKSDLKCTVYDSGNGISLIEFYGRNFNSKNGEYINGLYDKVIANSPLSEIRTQQKVFHKDRVNPSIICSFLALEMGMMGCYITHNDSECYSGGIIYNGGKIIDFAFHDSDSNKNGPIFRLGIIDTEKSGCDEISYDNAGNYIFNKIIELTGQPEIVFMEMWDWESYYAWLIYNNKFVLDIKFEKNVRESFDKLDFNTKNPNSRYGLVLSLLSIAGILAPIFGLIVSIIAVIVNKNDRKWTFALSLVMTIINAVIAIGVIIFLFNH